MFETFALILMVAILAALVWIGAGIYYLHRSLHDGVEVVDAQGVEMDFGLISAAQRAKSSDH